MINRRWGRGQTRWLATVGPAAVWLLSVVIAGAGRAQADTALDVQANGFRFCAASAAACTPLDNGSFTVNAGTTVTWKYTDTACDALVPCPGHNVTFPGSTAPTVKTDGAVLLTKTFPTAGRFDYQCTIHAASGMTGTVIVEAAATTPSTDASVTATTAATSGLARGSNRLDLAATGITNRWRLPGATLLLIVAVSGLALHRMLRGARSA